MRATAYALAALLGLSLVGLAATGSLGFAADDYWQLCALEGRSFPGGPTSENLFRFFSGNPGENLAAMREGAIPWYADPNVKVSFWRPLTASLHELDYRLFGTSAAGAKLHSLLWYLVLIFVVAGAYRQLMPSRVVAVSLIVFAVAASHWQPVAWLAARNALITATLGIGSLVLYLRWRSSGWRAGAALSLLLYAAALSAGEAAIGVLAYFVAWELLAAKGAVGLRVRALVPHLSLTMLWLAVYALQDFGTQASGAYLDPLSEPLVFLGQLPQRLAAMIGMTYLGFPADLWFLKPEIRALIIFGGLATVLLFAALLRPIWRSAPSSERRAILALGVGSLFAMVPQAAGFLGARSLTLPSLGAAALVGWILVNWRHSVSVAAPHRLRRHIRLVGLSLVAVVHLILAPLAWVALSVLYVHIERTTSTIASGIDVSPDRESAVVVLQAPDAFLERYLSFQRRVMGLPTPRVWRTLSLAPYAHRLTRTGTSSFELEVVDGHWMSSPFETLFRRATNPLLPGDSVDLGDMQADILEVDEVGPTRVKFRFDRSLDDHSLQFFAWQNQRMERFSMPPVGGRRLIAWEPGPATLW